MLEKLKKWNMWWTGKKVLQNQKGIVRKKVLDDLSLRVASQEMIVLTGVRRSGKSTLMFQMIDRLLEQGVAPENILYFNFDEPFEQGRVEGIELVYQTYLELHNPNGRKYVFFDEIQNMKDWERWVKKSYDYFGREVKFILTGSNNTMLHDSLAKLLTGRTLSKTVYPLSFEEFLYFNTVKISDQDIQKSEIRHHLSKFIEKGGFPEVVLSRDEFVNSRRLKEYFDSIILRDVAQPQNIREISKLIELANFSMTNVSSLMSYNNISKAIGLNITSLKDYLWFLENAFLLFQLKFFSYSVKESIMIQKQRKLYAIDSGLRNENCFLVGKDEGRLVENIVFLELKRRDKETYYWKGKGEVDFVVKNRDGSLIGINVTYGNRIAEREILALQEFRNRFKRVKKLILITNDIEKRETPVQSIPLWKWLLTKENPEQ